MRNKENLRKWAREYYQKRKNESCYQSKKRENAKKYYLSHKKQCDERRKKYFETHKEYYRQYRREWRWQNPNGIYSCLKLGAKRRNLLFELNKNDFVNWYIGQEKVCFYCHRNIEKIDEKNDFFAKRSKRLTIDRLDNLKGYTIGNIVLCCYRCNSIKGDFFSKNEMIKIGKIIQEKCTS